MALPEKYHLDAIRKLRGDAHVSFPGASTTVYKVERVYTEPRTTTPPAFGSADPEYTTALLIEQQVIGGDANNVEVYRLYHTLPGVATTRYAQDDETQTQVAITTQLIAKPLAADIAALNAPGTEVEYQPINDVYGTKITSVINGGVAPGARTEYRYTEYTFPALLTAITPGSPFEARDGTARLYMNSTRRSAFNRQALARVDITYGTQAALLTALAAITLFQPRLNDIVYNGIAFDVNERNVLNDAIGPLTFTSGTDNPKYPYFVETFSYAASATTATAYLALVASGTKQPISATLRPWRNGWYRLEVVNIRLQ